jgi:hypothetical protein
MEQRIVRVKSRKSLDKINISSSGGRLVPRIFSTDKKDGSQGSYEEDYNDRPFMGTKKFLYPTFNDIKRKWNWNADENVLARLIDEMNLRYPKSHEKAGQLIEVGKNVASRLTDISDPVFTHPDFYSNYFLSDGRGLLMLDDPKQEFIYYATSGSKKTLDKSKNAKNRYSNAVALGAELEMSTVGSDNKALKDDLDIKVLAIQYLAKLQNDETKMRKVCEIIRVPNYSKSTDANGMFIMLMQNAVENTDRHPDYGVSYQQKFIDLCEQDEVELSYQYSVIKALKAGILRRKSGYYSFAGERIDAKDRQEIIEFFSHSSNSDKFIELEDKLQAIK